jgi:diguanylate cyclase
MEKPPVNPTDAAREALKRLAMERVAPTPENFGRYYRRITGEPEEPARLDWATLVKELLREWERHQMGMTISRKREGLERLLMNFGREPAQLFPRLQALIKSWSGLATQAGLEAQAEGGDAVLPPAGTSPSAEAGEKPGASQDAWLRLREVLALALENGVAPRLGNAPELEAAALQLAGKARAVRDKAELEKLEKEFKQFWLKVELNTENDVELLEGLRHLLKLVIENVGELVLDEQWLRGQVMVVRDLLEHPLNVRTLYEAEQSFKGVVFKQSTLKHNLNEAKETLKNMVSSFIDRLGEMSLATGGFHDKLGHYSERISKTEDIFALNEIIGELMKDTRGMQLDIQRSRDELIETRRRVEEQEARIRALESELDHASEMVRQDHLTGTLNRRGMEDAFEREFARAVRTGAPLSVVILDVDHFKRFNDAYGHDTGDEALLHLVRTVREVMRPTDEIARFGGEEFVILMPETQADAAAQVMVRVQRELTRKIFLHKNQRLLITFSAGVAQWRKEESADIVLARADQSLYQAKEAGRNRVIIATDAAG